ncbi:lipase [Massilia eurypsychrophila]|uniref:Lipase n=2 Tax=Massilia eurypsychrophila TaxID=1485217 RepID=A0A2G8T941_9BURK|nr:lipase [Massilia eurypsychrophila]
MLVARRLVRRLLLPAALIALTLALPSRADEFADAAGVRYQVKPDLVYGTASGQQLKLDLYLHRAAAKGRAPAPLLVYFHGGGWVDGRKENAAFMLLPYLAMGWSVANVEYRLAKVAPAPAAVEDVRCALRWLRANAAAHGADASTMVVAGDSAGGHLALMAALLPAGSPFERACPTPDATRWNSGAEPAMNVAAVVNWFGIGDVEAMLDGPQQRHYAIEWFGSNSEREALARQLSPLRLVRAGLPPVISVHGKRDPVVPYSQAETLHAALDGAGVPNRLVTIETGNHGGFSAAEAQAANAAIRQFLRQQGLPVAP